MNRSVFISNSPTDTQSLAQKLYSLNPGPSVYALWGDLGLGKTTFTQFFAQTAGVKKRIQSPTFIIMRQLPWPDHPGQFIHLDLYRLDSVKDTQSFQIQEVLDQNQDLIIIEWPKIIKDLLPQNTTHVQFESLSDTSRRITISTNLFKFPDLKK